jgi:polar amino acid transport system substrate-binding protein
MGGMMRSMVVLVCLAMVAAGCGSRSDSPSAPASKPPLVIGMELEYPPFEMSDAAGKPSGISVDLAHALGKHLGREVKIENLPFDGLIPSLKTGKIDLIISSMTATEERAQSIDFSDPYVRTGICLLVAKDSKIQAPADAALPGLTIAVKKGTTGHIYATAHLPDAKLLVLDKDAACVLEVAQGKADAFIYDQLSIYQHWKRHPDTTRPVFEPLRAEQWAIGIRKGNDTLRAEVNAFLKQFQQAHGFDQLAAKYLRDQKATFDEMGVSFIF